MKRLLLCVAALILTASVCSAQEKLSIWNGPAPGEKDVSKNPTLLLFQPEKKTTDACLIICPGGCYNGVAVDIEGTPTAKYFVDKGMTVAILVYRTPRRPGMEKYRVAWQDAQRAVRFVRAHAEEWKINPEKIGVMGFSAGGHLSLMVSTTSQTPAYDPVDDLDKVPCHVNFAIPVYPAYVLDDGSEEYNSNKGVGANLMPEFAFDAKTPPMCFIHGDADGWSSMNSVAVYSKLKSMGIPAEVHVYAKVGHAFGGLAKGNHIGDWFNRAYEWMRVMKYVN